MQKIISTALASAFISSIMLVAATPAFADHERHHERYEESYEEYEEYREPEHRRKPQRAKKRKGHGHVARCKARYHSYNAHSDTFVGHDGRRHKCRL